MGGREEGEGGGFWVIRSDMTVSPLPAHGGQCFLFLVLVVTRSFCLSQGREMGGKKKKERKRGDAPPLMTPWIFLPILHPQEKQTPIYIPSYSLGTPSLYLQMKLPLILATPVIL